MRNPVEIDTAIAEQLVQLERAEATVRNYDQRVNGKFGSEHYRPQLGEALAWREELRHKIEELQDQYTGWTRYWLVTNANGHVHDSMHCTSCFLDTRYAWRTDLSGLTPEEVVEREAYRACSVCMPIAPAEQRAAYKRYTEEQRQARKAEKDAKAAEKRSKAAERARKLMAKVDKAYEQLMADTGTQTPTDALKALPARGPGSLYEWVYAFGEWDEKGRTQQQQTVADVMLADDRELREGKRASYDVDPRTLIGD